MHKNRAPTAQQQQTQKPAQTYSHRHSASQDYANSKPIYSATTSTNVASSLMKPNYFHSVGNQQDFYQGSSESDLIKKISPKNEEQQLLSRMTRTSYSTGGCVLVQSAQESNNITNPYEIKASFERIKNPAKNSNYEMEQNISQRQYNFRYQEEPRSQELTNSMPQNNNNKISNNNSHMNKILAHSTSLLTNDSYMAGMSSDSELTTGRHHYRPYSSQSRVYHAHPVPRNAHSSSRMSHYSDSSAPSYMPQQQNQHHQQQLQQQQTFTSSGPHHQKPPIGNAINNINKQPNLAHETSISSSGSGSSATNMYLDQGMVRPASSASQMHTRPFKQSMSIDHHALGHYHHSNTSVGPLNPLGQLSSPIHSMSANMEPAIATTTSVEALGDYQLQQQNLNYPQGSQHQTSQMAPLNQRYLQGSNRNFRQLEMEMLEKQTANINLYDKNTTNALIGCGSLQSPMILSSRPTPSPQHHRQLPSANIGSISVDHMNYQQQQIEQQFQPTLDHLQQQQQSHQQHKSLKQHQQDLYGSHQVNSTPADWLPPIGPSGQHLSGNRAAQFKQTMSIDHYPVNQPHHYHLSSSSSSANSTERSGSAGAPLQYTTPIDVTLQQQQQQPNTYRPSPVNFGPASSPIAYESPTRHLQQQHIVSYQSQQPTSSNQAHSDILYQYNEQQHPHSDQNVLNTQQPVISYGQSSGRGGISTTMAPTTMGADAQVGGIQKLHHQMSSSSSNSQSGSLRSSNVDISKTTAGTNVEQQKGGTLSHYKQKQHHQHGYVTKGYKSALSGLSSSNNALNEFGRGTDLSPSQQQQQQQMYSSGTHRAHRTILRAASPSLALDSTANSGGSYESSSKPHHHQLHAQQHNSSSSKDGGGSVSGVAGTRSEGSTALPNGPGSNSSLTKKSNSATQLSMTGTKKRLGFRKKQVTSFSVHRSEEVAPLEARHLVKQGSSVSEGDSSMSGDSSSRSWSNSNFKQQTSDELASMSFIDGLGKGQMISRQGLASPYLGDIQLSLCDRRGNLEIEVIRARNLQAKTNKILPQSVWQRQKLPSPIRELWIRSSSNN